MTQGNTVTGANHTCTRLRLVYDNRSDTAVDTITQTFRTYYTPKHRDGEYPQQEEGPKKTYTQTVGISAFTSKVTFWTVCAPELADKMNSPPPGGYFMTDIGATPDTFTWTWFD